MYDFSVAIETSLWLQHVEAFNKVDCESFLQEHSLRKDLEGLSMQYQSIFKVSNCFLNQIFEKHNIITSSHIIMLI